MVKLTREVIPYFQNQSFVFKTERIYEIESNWHHHPDFEILWIEKGYGKLFSGDQTFEIKENGLFLFTSENPHLWLPDLVQEEEINSYIQTVIQFNKNIFNPFNEDLVELAHIKKILSSQTTVYKLNGDAYKAISGWLMEMKISNEFNKFILLLRILDYLANHINLDAPVNHIPPINDSIVANKMNKIMNYVAKHYQQEISLSTIADEIGFEQSYFCRFFKKHTKKTFIDFLNQYRISKACILMRQKAYLHHDIYSQVGFSDQSYFHKLFKRYIGKTPSEYREAKI